MQHGPEVSPIGICVGGLTLKDRWSRSDKIGLVGVLIAVLAGGSAILIPELRSWLGLETTNNNTAASENANTINTPSPISERANLPATSTNDKVAGIVVIPGKWVETELSETPNSIQRWKVQLQDISIYRDGRTYLKIGVCNIGYGQQQLDPLQVWYTPYDQSGSANWGFEAQTGGTNETKWLVELKRNECQSLGSWSKEQNTLTLFSKPFGTVFVKRSASFAENTIFLSDAGSRGKAQLMYFDK